MSDAMRATPHDGEDALRQAMHGLVRGGTIVVLASVSPEGVVSTALCSWIVAKGPRHLAMALDVRSSAYASIRAGCDQIALEIMADDILLSVRGRASVGSEWLDDVPFPCALVWVEVIEIRSHMIEGLRFAAPRYVFADDKRHRADVEQRIFAQLENVSLR
ncbi:MAG TPA: hypothetical protein VEJ20_07510 [Candidatus Eremiobacteraceae bacterium]|nr:hypothetical protein [Candidatus Eremiobacteraceae bacterium]